MSTLSKEEEEQIRKDAEEKTDRYTGFVGKGRIENTERVKNWKAVLKLLIDVVTEERIKAKERRDHEIENLKSVMIAAAEEIQQHWQAHCDDEGYGPSNLMHRLEAGIASNYAGYKFGEFTRMQEELNKLRAEAESLKDDSYKVGFEHGVNHENEAKETRISELECLLSKAREERDARDVEIQALALDKKNLIAMLEFERSRIAELSKEVDRLTQNWEKDEDYKRLESELSKAKERTAMLEQKYRIADSD